MKYFNETKDSGSIDFSKGIYNNSEFNFKLPRADLGIHASVIAKLLIMSTYITECNETITQSAASKQYYLTRSKLLKLGYKAHSKDIGYAVKLKPYKQDGFNIFTTVAILNSEIQKNVCQSPVRISFSASNFAKRMNMESSLKLLKLMDTSDFLEVMEMKAKSINNGNTVRFMRSHRKASQYSDVTFIPACFGLLVDNHDKCIDMVDLMLKAIKETLNDFGYNGLANSLENKKPCSLPISMPKSVVMDGQKYMLIPCK